MNPKDGPPDSARIDELTETMVQILKRLEQVEARLAQLDRSPVAERRTEVPHAERPLSTTVAPPPLPPQAAPPPLPPFRPPAFAPPVSAPPTPPPDRPHLETRMGLLWINRIGVVTLIIGVAFFFKYAIDNQWIGETGRVALGVLAGLVALGAGDFLWRRGQRTFAQGICGLGISILYLSFYASFGFYHLLPQAAAFLLMVLVTAAAGAFALRYEALSIAALGLLGGYATPLLLSTGHDAPWTLFSYLFLLNVGALAISRVRHWRVLELLAFVATALIYAAWYVDWFRPEKRVVATVAALTFYALFAFVEWSGIFYAAQVFAELALAGVWTEPTPYLGLSLILGAAGLAIAGRPSKPLAGTFSFAVFWGAYAIWRASHPGSSELGVIFAFITAAFIMYVAWLVFDVVLRGCDLRPQQLAVLGLNGAAYYASSYVLLTPEYTAWMGLLAVAVAAVYVLFGIRLWKGRGEAAANATPAVLLALGIALGFLTLAIPIQFSGFSITLAWAIEAAALTWISRRTNEVRMIAAALAVFAFVFFRLYLFDFLALGARHTALINPRFLTFVVSAVSFGLSAWWLRAKRLAAAVLYVTAHFVMLSACLMEFSDWVATAVRVEDRPSLMAIGISIILAVYAVALIAAGFGFRSVLDRVLGLGLMGLVIVKLYLYDVWEAGRLFRMAAFVALGALLLLTSYLYSRFRPSIESWWRDDRAKK